MFGCVPLASPPFQGGLNFSYDNWENIPNLSINQCGKLSQQRFVNVQGACLPGSSQGDKEVLRINSPQENRAKQGNPKSKLLYFTDGHF